MASMSRACEKVEAASLSKAKWLTVHALQPSNGAINVGQDISLDLKHVLQAEESTEEKTLVRQGGSLLTDAHRCPIEIVGDEVDSSELHSPAVALEVVLQGLTEIIHVVQLVQTAVAVVADGHGFEQKPEVAQFLRKQAEKEISRARIGDKFVDEVVTFHLCEVVCSRMVRSVSTYG